MSLLFATVAWLAPSVLLLTWQTVLWRENHPEVLFVDWLRADPLIAGMVVGAGLLWLIPLGIWSITTAVIIFALYGLASSSQQRREWSQRLSPRLLAVSMILLIHLLAGFIPPSAPVGADAWGEPLTTESKDAPPFPASEQYIWVLVDGTIVVETHIHVLGTLNPWLADSGVNAVSKLFDTKEARFQDAVSLMYEWTGPESFALEPIHGGVRHDYDGENLLYTHDDIMLDLFGMHSSGEMVTVFRPAWGGELHLLTVIKIGSDPFIGNPGAHSYVLDWLSSDT